MKADAWDLYAGPLSDCPGERAGYDYDDDEPDRPDAAELRQLERDLRAER